jgi:general L-amino acid transport system permease protein
MPTSRNTAMLHWCRRNLFANWWQASLTCAGAALIAAALPPLFRWAVLDARITGSPQDCAAAAGACWAFVVDNLPLFLFGTYPADERWRAIAWLVLVLAVGMAGLFAGSGRARVWLVLATFAVLVGVLLLGGGETLGLPPVASGAWGGLALTLLLSSMGILASFPIGVLLALGRTNRGMPLIRVLSAGAIELIRSVPLVSILFLSSVLLPLFFAEGVTVDKLLRAQVGIIVFQAAYMAEVVRGGLQAVPTGQDEAAAALGLGYARRMRLIVLPQALRKVIPALVNQVIITIKDTSLVVVIGMFDLLGAAELAVRNVTWAGRNFEAYAFIGLIYWTLCYSVSQASYQAEMRINRDGGR